jgi:hypothetical protein
MLGAGIVAGRRGGGSFAKVIELTNEKKEEETRTAMTMVVLRRAEKKLCRTTLWVRLRV